MTLRKRAPNCMETKRGVIAVLFLFVVGFIFGAISLSMNTGQIIERRIASDQVADSAVFAFASKSAQGLNFIAANNLAIAAASHMTGVLHLVADWVILIKLAYKADCFQMGRFKTYVPEYQNIYKMFRPVVKLYFRSASGLTSLNTYIAKIFPLLGMVDSVSVGGANAPGAIIVPFGANREIQKSKQTAANQSLVDRMKKSLSSVVTNVSPHYKGLTRLNSDETFCLAYESGKRALGKDDAEDIGGWMTSDIAPSSPAALRMPLQMIGGLVDGVTAAIDAFGLIGKFISYRVGFSGCGFGATGKGVSQSRANDSRPISDLFKLVLVGPLSGREINFAGESGDPTLANMKIRPQKDESALKQEVNNLTKYDCELQPAGRWKSTIKDGVFTLNTKPMPETGVCIAPRSSLKRYLKRDLSGRFDPGSPLTHSNPPLPEEMYLYDYDVVCHGTILFEWEAFSGPLYKSVQNGKDDKGNDKYEGQPIPAKGSHAKIAKDDVKSDLCPSFQANDGRGVQGPITLKTELGLSREKPFVEPILEFLRYSPPDLDDEPDLQSDKPPSGTFDTVMEMVNCAAKIDGACPFEEGGRGYFENIKGDRFYPNMDQLNWLCPVSASDDTDGMIAKNFKFPHAGRPPMLNPRWPIARDVNNEFESKYWKLEEWHNRRVDDMVRRMKCDEYRKFASEKRKKPPADAPEDTATAAHRRSNNYCDGDAHMCWQRGLQKQYPARKPHLKEGHLSFLVPTVKNGHPDESLLESSLNYGVLSLNPLRVDNRTDIIGRDDGTTMAHCPPNMSVKARVDTAEIEVCDVQPVIGLISRIVSDNSGVKQDLKGDEQFGAGTTNLASGGGIETTNAAAVGLSTFMSIAQAKVVYTQDPAVKDPKLPAKQPLSKVHQLFWPSWKPRLMPSRVMSSLLPPSVAYFVED